VKDIQLFDLIINIPGVFEPLRRIILPPGHKHTKYRFVIRLVLQ
jgi:hypothetical protein